MSLDINASGDLFAVSGLAQADSATPATLDKLLLVDESSGVTINDNREHNQAEKTGQVEPTEVDILDRSAEASINVAKAAPDALAWAFSFLFGDHTAAAAGGGFLHTSRLTSYPVEPNYFTAVHRKGGAGGGSAALERHIGLGIDKLGMSFAKGEFVPVNVSALGTGNFSDGLKTEVIPALDDTVSLTLSLDPENGVADPSVVTVWADVDQDGQYEQELTPVAYDSGTNVLTISSAGGGGVTTVNYIVTYPVASTEAGYAWSDLHLLQVPQEFKLKAANVQIILGGVYAEPAGVPTITGGQVAGCEVDSVEYEASWNGGVGRCWRSGAAPVDYARSVDLGSMLQNVKLTRRVRDYLFKQSFDANLPLSLKINAIGAEYEAGQSFEFNLLLPRMKFLEKPLSVSDGKWVDEGSLVVLKDASVDNWPSAVATIRNEVSTYLA